MSRVTSVVCLNASRSLNSAHFPPSCTRAAPMCLNGCTTVQKTFIQPIHYRLRPIEVFIRDFSTFPLILSNSKYFRYVFQLSVSFYQRPNIPDIFACDKIKDPPFTFFPLIYCNIQKWQTENFWQIKRDELNSANIWSMRLEPKIENRYLLF